MKHPYQKNTRMVYGEEGGSGKGGSSKKVIVGSEIGSVEPIPKGMEINNNSKAQAHDGSLGAVAAKHMSAGVRGNVWTTRAGKAQKQAKTPRNSTGLTPINHAAPALKKVRPD